MVQTQTQEELSIQLKNYALKIYKIVYEDTLYKEYKELDKECQLQTYNVGLPRSLASACHAKDSLINNVVMNMLALRASLYRITYSIKDNEELCPKYIDHIKRLIKDLMEQTESLEKVQRLLREIYVTVNKVKKTKALKLKRCKEDEVSEMIKEDQNRGKEEFNWDEFYYGEEEYSKHLSEYIDECMGDGNLDFCNPEE